MILNLYSCIASLLLSKNVDWLDPGVRYLYLPPTEQSLISNVKKVLDSSLKRI